MRYHFTVAFAGLAATSSPALAAGIDLTITIPQLKVAEYHRPYVAVWLEQPGGQAVKTIALWYDHDKKANEGTKWLRDVRGWWRKSGRTMTFPADGITGATRAPGPQTISFQQGKGSLGKLPPGQYVLMVEAAREVGGREQLRLPFVWPAKGKPATISAAGTTELGAVNAVIRP